MRLSYLDLSMILWNWYSSQASLTLQLYQQRLNRLPPAIPSVTMNPPASSSQAISFPSGPTRGLNYYQTLIHQHGGERQEPLQQLGRQFAMHHQPVASQASTADIVSSGTMTARDTKQRPTKPCAYFNSARGCRNGANCTFLHDVSAARKEQPKGSKRIKLDSRIAGRYWGGCCRLIFDCSLVQNLYFAFFSLQKMIQ